MRTPEGDEDTPAATDGETLRALHGTWRESVGSAPPRWGEHWTFTVDSDAVEAFIDGSPGDGFIYVLTGTLTPARAGGAPGRVSLAGTGYKPGTRLLREVRCEIFGPFDDTLVVRRAEADLPDANGGAGASAGVRPTPVRQPDTVLRRASRQPS